MNVVASIVITTRSRSDELRRALRSAVAQEGEIEILVIDDASTDDTAEMVRKEFPQVRLDVSEKPLGLIVQRNRAAALAMGPVIFSIDDDAEFQSADSVRRVLPLFDDPRVGAVAMPFRNVNLDDDRVYAQPPDTDKLYAAATYIGTAHALRRDIFLRLGGYRGFLFQYGEERDYSLRLLDAGYLTVLADTLPILHYVSKKRHFGRGYMFQARAQLLHHWYNTPMPQFPVRLLGATVNLFRLGWHRRAPGWVFVGAIRGYLDMFRQLSSRTPISRATNRLDRLLTRRGAISVAEIAAMGSQCFQPDRLDASTGAEGSAHAR